MEEWNKIRPSAIWIKVPLTHSHLIPVAAGVGFKYHHAEGDSATMCQWMQKDVPSMLPQFATHQIGVAGTVCS